MKFLLILHLCLAVLAQTPAPKPAAAAKPKPAAAKPKPSPVAAPKAAAAVKPADPVVLSVGAQKMTKSEFEQLLNVMPPNMKAQAATPQGRRGIAQQLVELLALSQQARTLKIDQEPATRSQLRIQTEQVLASAALKKLVESTPVPAEEIEKYYLAQKSQYEQLAASHILIRFKGSQVPLREGQTDLDEKEALAKANQIKQRIANGESFAAIAKAESDDVGSAANGGSLGSFGKGQMVPEFDKAAFELPQGQISEPVRTQFGYHVIQGHGRTTRALEEVRSEIEAKLKPERARQIASDTAKKTTVVMDESYFGAASTQ
jgi:peptidyl-prolyl cis-trans isomerase C